MFRFWAPCLAFLASLFSCFWPGGGTRCFSRCPIGPTAFSFLFSYAHHSDFFDLFSFLFGCACLLSVVFYNSTNPPHFNNFIASITLAITPNFTGERVLSMTQSLTCTACTPSPEKCQCHCTSKHCLKSCQPFRCPGRLSIFHNP